MELIDLRRLTGPLSRLNGTGAIAEVRCDWRDGAPVVARWRHHARRMMDAAGWQDHAIRVQDWPGGVSLMISAPMDALYPACDVIEWAWARARADLGEGEAAKFDEAVDAVRDKIARDARPALVALAEFGREANLSVLTDTDAVSLGLGTGSREWSIDAIPPVADLDRSAFHQIPVALVTGTNGKSTTTRLLAHIVKCAGKVVGISGSDWVRVGDEILDRGDYSGPSGARMALRDPRTEIATLEVARGGLMRRGLVMQEADAVGITNIAADHLGEYGITDLATLTKAKFQVARALKPDGVLVLNADDPELCRQSVHHDGEIAWISLEPAERGLGRWIGTGGRAAILEDEMLVLAAKGERRALIDVSAMPLAMGGAARFNVANGLMAAQLASILGLADDAITEGLRSFEPTPENNPGRGNIVRIGGVTGLVDFAHNAHGVRALMEALGAMPAERRAVLIGHAGDREDTEIRNLTKACVDAGADLFVVKELEKVLRGREKGEIPKLVIETLKELDVDEDAIRQAENEIEAVRIALDWAREGDLLLLLTHVSRDDVMTLLNRLQEEGWTPGNPLPD